MGKVVKFSNIKRGITMRKTNAQIERIVEDICREHNVNILDVDPVKLADQLGIIVQEVEFNDSDISGILSHEGDKYTISINMYDSYERKRFTVAHELGHYWLGHLKETDSNLEIFRKCATGDDKEIEANKFAAALLVNSSYLKAMYEVSKIVNKDYTTIVTKLAEKFHVSKQTLHYRLKSIGVFNNDI